MQKCTNCFETKPLEAFGINKAKTSNSVNYRAAQFCQRTICKACEAKRARQFRKEYAEKHGKGYTGSGKLKSVPEKHKYVMSAIRAKVTESRSNNKRCSTRPFNIDADYIYKLWLKQNNKCAYTNQEFVLEKGHSANMSIDRIQPELGYIKGNVQLLCWAVNRAKGDLPEKVFFKMCKIIHKRATTIPKRSRVK